MRSHLTAAFRKHFEDLPDHVKERARRSYRLWQQDPAYPGLDFKRVHPSQPVYSVRVGIGWRAVGWREGDTIVWFWIGSHAEYDAMLRQL